MNLGKAYRAVMDGFISRRPESLDAPFLGKTAVDAEAFRFVLCLLANTLGCLQAIVDTSADPQTKKVAAICFEHNISKLPKNVQDAVKAEMAKIRVDYKKENS